MLVSVQHNVSADTLADIDVHDTSEVVEHRRNKRRPFHRRAWIFFGAKATVPVLMQDISHSGARILTPLASALPNIVALGFTRDGQVLRWCKKAWQANHSVGLAFLTPDERTDLLRRLRTRRRKLEKRSSPPQK